MSEVILTNHAQGRLFERNVDVHEAKKIAKNGKIVEIQSDGGIIKTGLCSNGRPLTVVIFKISNKILIKTVYYED